MTLPSVPNVVSPFHPAGLIEASLTPPPSHQVILSPSPCSLVIISLARQPHMGGPLRVEGHVWPVLSIQGLALGRCPLASQRAALWPLTPAPGVCQQWSSGWFVNTALGLCRCEIVPQHSWPAELFPVELITSELAASTLGTGEWPLARALEKGTGPPNLSSWLLGFIQPSALQRPSPWPSLFFPLKGKERRLSPVGRALCQHAANGMTPAQLRW